MFQFRKLSQNVGLATFMTAICSPFSGHLEILTKVYDRHSFLIDVKQFIYKKSIKCVTFVILTHLTD